MLVNKLEAKAVYHSLVTQKATKKIYLNLRIVTDDNQNSWVAKFLEFTEYFLTQCGVEMGWIGCAI